MDPLSEFIPEKRLAQLLLPHNDHCLLQYYGGGLAGSAHSYIFRKRIQSILDFLVSRGLRPTRALDLGCGSMIASYVLTKYVGCLYVGIDVLCHSDLRKYATFAERGSDSRQSVNVVRASIYDIPLIPESFDLIIALDTLEHLQHPQRAIDQIRRVATEDACLIVSLPLESHLQRLSRIGFRLLGKKVPLTVPYHYAGGVKGWKAMLRTLDSDWQTVQRRFSPVGLVSHLNINVLVMFRRRS